MNPWTDAPGIRKNPHGNSAAAGSPPPSAGGSGTSAHKTSTALAAILLFVSALSSAAFAQTSRPAPAADSAPAAAPAPALAVGDLAVTTSAVPLKSGERVVQTLPQGTVLQIRRINGKWTLVDTASTPVAVQGWVQVSQVAAATPSRIHPVWVESLGVFLVRVDALLSADLKVPNGYLAVARVAQGSAAAEAGLREGDAFPGVPAELQKPDSQAKLTVTRPARTATGKTASSQTVSLVLQTRKHDLNDARLGGPASAPPGSGQAGRRIAVGRTGADFRTITAALLVAQPGDIVEVRPAVYTEEILLRTGVTLRSRLDEGTAVITGGSPVRSFGASNLLLEGLTVSGEQLSIGLQHASNVTLRHCTASHPTAPGLVFAQNVRDLNVEHCTLVGNENGTAVTWKESSGRFASSTVSASKFAITVIESPDVEISDTLLEILKTGIAAIRSKIAIRGNTLSGTPKSTGMAITDSTVTIENNAIRKCLFGIDGAGLKGTLTGNTISQNTIGLVLDSGDVVVRDCVFLNNAIAGAEIGFREAKGDVSRQVTLTGNSIQGNAWGVRVHRGFTATVDHNLLEGNHHGVVVESAEVEIAHNTFVGHLSMAIKLLPHARAQVTRNIIAFNQIGVAVDVEARYQAEANNVYSNLASKEFPLLEANYARIDRVPTSRGERLHVLIFPTDDLKSGSDLSVDPQFVELGADYHLQAGSPLASPESKEPLAGAFPAAKQPL
jgi:nitrous oxidase accessory protein NosD